MKFYIPVIIEGREKYEFRINSLNVFATEKLAVDSLIRLLLSSGKIFPEVENDDIELSCEKYKIMIKNGENVDYEDNDEPCTYDEILNILIQYVNTFDKLKIICKNHDDSYYEEGWKIELFEREPIE